MSRLDELIKELCPDGVEYKKLEDVVSGINIGINPRKFFKLNPDNPVGYYVTVRELNGLNGVKQYDKTDLISQDAIDKIAARAHIEIGDILFSNTGTVGKMALVIESPHSWGVNEGIYVIKPDKEIIDSRFLYYYLDSNMAYKGYSSKLTGSTLRHVTQKALASVKVPVPPIEIQEEIVKILDRFTNYVTELQAELQARKLQYEYYRDKLLPFEDSGVEWEALKDISCIVRGASPRPIKNFITDDTNGVNWIKIGDAAPGSKYIESSKERITEDGAKKSRRVFPGNFILSNSMSFGRPYILRIEGCIHDGWLSISEYEEIVTTDYLYHILTSSYIQRVMKQKASFGGAVQNLNADIVRSIEIPIVEKKRQEEIVSTLDMFSTFCTDITSGLPAEIEARQKQYEYYRDKLLSFKEIES